jgi:hypothetical protein
MWYLFAAVVVACIIILFSVNVNPY